MISNDNYQGGDSCLTDFFPAKTQMISKRLPEIVDLRNFPQALLYYQIIQNHSKSSQSAPGHQPLFSAAALQASGQHGTTRLLKGLVVFFSKLLEMIS